MSNKYEYYLNMQAQYHLNSSDIYLNAFFIHRFHHKNPTFESIFLMSRDLQMLN